MNENEGMPLPPPRVVPPLDSAFRPAVLANRAFRQRVHSGNPVPVRLALEQTDGNVSHFETEVSSEPGLASANAFYLERIVKFLLWSRGGFRLHVDGPTELAARLAAHYRD